MADETRRLAAFAAGLVHEVIPATARARALDLIVDQIGVQLGCSDLPWARQVRDAYRCSGGTAEATVVRYGDRLPVIPAAFINSTFGHSFEFDDGNPLIHGHLGAELIPALMAVAERDHIPGRDFLTALVAAYEVRGHIGWALSPGMMEHGGPQYSTTCGPFGVAAGVAKLLGLGAEGICNALGIAGGYSGGLMQYDHGGGSVKRIYTAIAAASGMQAAQLAQAGITGPEEILEGARGLLKIHCPDYRLERLVADLGEKWTIELTRFKPYCCCGGIHPAIDGLAKLVSEHKLKAEVIESVEVSYAMGFHDHAAITAPHDLLGMQFSTSYSLALTVLTGRNTPGVYTMEALADPRVAAFAAKVTVRGDAELTRLFEGRQPARVRVRTTSGEIVEELVAHAKGSPGAPLTSDEIDEKFRSQAVDILGVRRSDELLRVLRHVDELEDMAALPAMLIAGQK